MLTKYLFFGFLILAVFLEIAGDILFKKWAVSLKYEYLSKAISIFTILNLVIITSVGVILFKEDISLINTTGIALGVIGVIFVEI